MEVPWIYLLGTWIFIHMVSLLLGVKYPIFTYQADVEEKWKQTFSHVYSSKLDTMAASYNLTTKTLCSIVPPGLGQQTRTLNLRGNSPPLSLIEQLHPAVLKGGEWWPTDCQALQRVAIVIPYRDRWHHLLFLLYQLHPILQKQQCHYRIFVSEQVNAADFNKGRVMNVGYVTAMKLRTWDCVIFHDVDLIPETDLNLYRCADDPLHLSAGVDELRYTLMYKELVGGVLAMTKKQFETANGYSNSYWGWGGEDDDMDKRITKSGMSVLHASTQRGRYKMVPHKKREPSSKRIALLADEAAWTRDGLNSLSSLDARVIAVQEFHLYTNITVNVGSGAKSRHSSRKWLDLMVPVVSESF